MLAENINLISSLFAVQRFIFVQLADEAWLGKFDFVLKIFNNFLNDFKTQQAFESFDNYDHNIEGSQVAHNRTKITIGVTTNSDQNKII